jgi:hypothetical protein
MGSAHRACVHNPVIISPVKPQSPGLWTERQLFRNTEVLVKQKKGGNSFCCGQQPLLLRQKQKILNVSVLPLQD